MRDIFKYEKRHHYPHMKPRDIEIWERFLVAYPKEYQAVQYDFHVGDPPGFNPLYDDGTDKNQDALYRLKIDVIGHRGNALDIVELKPDAGPSAIGQVTAYKTLYLRDEAPKLPVNVVIVTNVLRPNMADLCISAGITLIVV